jgi:hypothetical protein
VYGKDRKSRQRDEKSSWLLRPVPALQQSSVPVADSGRPLQDLACVSSSSQPALVVSLWIAIVREHVILLGGHEHEDLLQRRDNDEVLDHPDAGAVELEPVPALAHPSPSR